MSFPGWKIPKKGIYLPEKGIYLRGFWSKRRLQSLVTLHPAPWRSFSSSLAAIFLVMIIPNYWINSMNSGGTGRHGGNCHLEELPNIGSSQELLKTSFEYNTDQCAVGETKQIRSMEFEFIECNRDDSPEKRRPLVFVLLMPKVGPAPLHHQDCNHWCPWLMERASMCHLPQTGVSSCKFFKTNFLIVRIHVLQHEKWTSII